MTSRNAKKTVRRTSLRLDSSDRYFDQEHCETNRLKRYSSISGFNVFDDFDLDLWPMFFLSHKVGMKY